MVFKITAIDAAVAKMIKLMPRMITTTTTTTRNNHI